MRFEVGELLHSFRVPCPPDQLHPNGRAGWKSKWAKNKKQREVCRDIAIAELRDGWIPLSSCAVRLAYQFGCARKGGTRQRHDPDNLIAWAKGTIDGLGDASVFVNDRSLIYFPPSQEFDSGQLGDWLVVEVYAIAEQKNRPTG